MTHDNDQIYQIKANEPERNTKWLDLSLIVSFS